MPNLLWLYFSLNGRVNRQKFWLFYLLPAVLLGLISYWVASSYDKTDFVGDLIAIGLLWPSIALQVKRWHDINKSGWWVLINLVPIVGSLSALVVNGFVSGTTHENRFGPTSATISVEQLI